MASILTDIFQAEHEVNHDDHAKLAQDLAELDVALEALGGPNGLEQVRRLQRRLSDELPRHFATEEKTVLSSMGLVHPELKPFCKAMKRQHAMLRANWERLKRMTEELEYSGDRRRAMALVREYGRQFTRQLAAHMSAEEKKIAEVLG